MFKHILLPTDGSPLAAKAIKAGIALAKETGAKVTAYYALPPVQQLYYGDSYVMDRRRIAQFERDTQQVAQKHLARIQQSARAAGVALNSLMTRELAPHQGIIDAARRRKCDAIFMASRGRGSLSSLLLGSVTQKVLAHSKVPVVVYR